MSSDTKTPTIPLSKIVFGLTSMKEVMDLATDTKTGYRLAKMNAFMEEEAAFFYSLRDKLVAKYGEQMKDDNGKDIPGAKRCVPGMQHWQEFQTAMDPLLGTEIPFPFEKIDVKSLPAKSLKAKHISDLSFMFAGLPTEEDSVDAALKARAEARKAALAESDKEEAKEPVPAEGNVVEFKPDQA